MFRKNNTEGSFSQKNVRRRFHHFLLSKRKSDSLSKTTLPRKKHVWKKPPSGAWLFLRKVFFFVFVSGALVALFYIVFFSQIFVITKISFEKSGEAITAAQIAPFLDKLKGKNMLFLNTAVLTKELEQTFKNEILLVRIKKSYPKHLIVKFDEYPAVINLRIITDLGVQKLVLNQIGYAIFENVEQKDIPTLIVRLPKFLPGKSVVIDKQKLKTIAGAFTAFHDLFGMKITEGQWLKTERELHLKTEKNFSVWLDLTANIDQQLGKLKRSLIKLDIYNERLEYIDLRIPGGESEKIIFKRKT